MEEFANYLEEDWGLQAIVRGCSHDHQAAPSFDPVTIHIPDIDDHIFAFPDLFGANSSDNDTVHVNELDELYKPFYPMFNSFSRQTPITTSTNSFPEEEVKLNSVEIQIDLQKEKIPTQSTIVARPKIAARAATYKRRKNQHKRVVVQVTAEDISSDLWAWRKYGQKPIKGSPYPRSYYRCSSLKGCLARKQVEQSCSDPGMFIITYSAEHSHSQPTRRSSLAGTNRHKLTTAKSPSPVLSCLAKFKEPSSSPTSDITVISPTISNLMQSNIDEELIIPQKPITSEKIDILNDEQMVEDISNGDFDIPSEILNADFFVGLEDLDRLISDSAFYNCSTK